MLIGVIANGTDPVVTYILEWSRESSVVHSFGRLEARKKASAELRRGRGRWRWQQQKVRLYKT